MRSHEGFPRSPAVEAADDPCYLLARTCVLHFSSTQVPPFSCLHLSPLYRATPHLDGLWDRLCGSDVNGGTGVLCWQGVRFLLNRLQGKQSRQDVSWAASYFPSNSPHGEAQNQEVMSWKVLWSHLVLFRWKFSPGFPGTQFPGFCLRLLEWHLGAYSLVRQPDFPLPLLSCVKVFLIVNWNWCGSYMDSWWEWDLYSILVSLVSPT